jgi:drug/metabolite transporter (DMT)-like permease
MHLRGNLMLLLAAFIWGTTFVAQMVGMDGLGPFTYAAARYILGFLFLVGLWYAWRGQREGTKRAGTYRAGWKAGLGAGCIMLVATSLQAGKTAFITALYIIFVPLGAVLLGKRIHLENWIGAALALVGLYLLSIRGAVSLSFGDGLVFISALFWTGHILFIDRFASLVDPIELSLTQVGVCAAGSLIAALGFETVAVQPILDAWFAIFYGGVMSAGVAFTLQILGQKYAEPGQAAIIMSFEAVFGALSSWLLLGEHMSAVQVLGCALMLSGMIVTQVRPLLEDRRHAS